MEFNENIPMGEIAECVKKLDKNVAKVDALKRVFSAIVDRKNVQLTMITAIHILKHNLDSDLTTLIKEKKNLILPLVKSLIYYISCWPGWAKSKEYYSNQLTYKKWYNEFENYLQYKIKALLNNYEKYVSKESANVGNILSEDSNYQLLLHTNNDNLSYHLRGDDLIFNQIKTTSKTLIEFSDLLNLPYFAIEINLPNLRITRKNVHEINQCITKKSNIFYVANENESCVDVLPIASDVKNQNPCSLVQLKKCFLNILKKLESQKIYAGNFECCFSQFILDLQECVSVNDELPVNLYVTYNIGKSTFNKQINMVECDDKEMKLNVMETITPKIQFGLHSIDLNDIDANSYKFDDLNLMHVFKTACTMCNENFNGKYSVHNMLRHYKEIHTFPGVLICRKCQKKDTYFSFSKARWTHTCEQLVFK